MAKIFCILIHLMFVSASSMGQLIKEKGLIIYFWDRIAFFKVPAPSIDTFNYTTLPLGKEISYNYFTDRFKSKAVPKMVKTYYKLNDEDSIIEKALEIRYLPVLLTYKPLQVKYKSDTCHIGFYIGQKEVHQKYICNELPFAIEDIQLIEAKKARKPK